MCSKTLFQNGSFLKKWDFFRPERWKTKTAKCTELRSRVTNKIRVLSDLYLNPLVSKMVSHWNWLSELTFHFQRNIDGYPGAWAYESKPVVNDAHFSSLWKLLVGFRHYACYKCFEHDSGNSTHAVVAAVFVLLSNKALTCRLHTFQAVSTTSGHLSIAVHG